jgi:putative nucleotidyltransferase with HDIG domain
MFEREYRDLAFVPRWGIARTIRTQSVAEHSFYVAIYAEQLGYWLGFDEGFLAHAALYHDIDECFMSDIPGPVKRNISDKEKMGAYRFSETQRRFGPQLILSDEIKSIIKCADLLDECFFLTDEIELGNKSVTPFLVNSMERLNRAWENLPWLEDRETKNTLWDKYVAPHLGMEVTSRIPTNDTDVENVGS